jgi:hypothetical protein
VNVWLPLNGPNERGLAPKGCSVSGWSDPAYKGVDVLHDGWLGMRLDQLVVIDCDNEEAKDAWLAHIDKPFAHTAVRKTPHGYHFLYARTVDAYGITGQKLPSIHMKMELKTGVGHQIVWHAPGYEFAAGEGCVPMDFDLSWVPVVIEHDKGIAEWDEMPDGIGNSAMISFGGKFREWGMDEKTIRRCLWAINEITMTEAPMTTKEVRTLARQAAKYGTGDHEPQTVECLSCGFEMEVR